MSQSASAIVSRRNLFKSAAMATGLAMLSETVAQENNPAANVVDRGVDWKIKSLRRIPSRHEGVPENRDAAGHYRLGRGDGA